MIPAIRAAILSWSVAFGGDAPTKAPEPKPDPGAGAAAAKAPVTASKPAEAKASPSGVPASIDETEFQWMVNAVLAKREGKPETPIVKQEPPAPVGSWHPLSTHPGLEGFGVIDANGYLQTTKWRRAGTTEEHEGRAPDSMQAAPVQQPAPTYQPFRYLAPQR